MFFKDPTSGIPRFAAFLSSFKHVNSLCFRDISGYILQSLGWTPATPPVTESLQSLETRFIQLESKTLQEMAEQRAEVERMERALRESEDNITRANQLREDGHVGFFGGFDFLGTVGGLVAKYGRGCSRNENASKLTLTRKAFRHRRP